ncbi:hypothetical protein [Roseibium algae]|uniref:SH3 domain-containing protein n=1 Tax=Roseibium algae TaxID=3123038 RepID=A0ABU8TIA4_9HYPH
MAQRFYCAASVSVLLAMTATANSTIACSIISNVQGAESIGLYRLADETSGIIRKIPLGDLVEYPAEDLAPTQAEGWAWVRHDINQDVIWQTGVYGWMKIESISDCG